MAEVQSPPPIMRRRTSLATCVEEVQSPPPIRRRNSLAMYLDEHNEPAPEKVVTGLIPVSATQIEITAQTALDCEMDDFVNNLQRCLVLERVVLTDITAAQQPIAVALTKMPQITQLRIVAQQLPIGLQDILPPRLTVLDLDQLHSFDATIRARDIAQYSESEFLGEYLRQSQSLHEFRIRNSIFQHHIDLERHLISGLRDNTSVAFLDLTWKNKLRTRPSKSRSELNLVLAKHSAQLTTFKLSCDDPVDDVLVDELAAILIAGHVEFFWLDSVPLYSGSCVSQLFEALSHSNVHTLRLHNIQTRTSAEFWQFLADFVRSSRRLRHLTIYKVVPDLLRVGAQVGTQLMRACRESESLVQLRLLEVGAEQRNGTLAEFEQQRDGFERKISHMTGENGGAEVVVSDGDYIVDDKFL